jgi:hypothetical protein
MSPPAIEVGAFSWARIQRLYDADAVTHWQRCDAEGLPRQQEVFTQLFHAEDPSVAQAGSADERPGGANLLSLDSVRGIDWGRVIWELTEMSGLHSGMYASIGNTSMRSMRRGIAPRSLGSRMTGKRLSVIGTWRRVGSCHRCGQW